MEVLNTQLFQNKIFPNNLTVANITPIFKKGYSTLEKNYRPVSILPVVSKILEKQISNYIEKHLSRYLRGYRKGFNTQHALIEN